MGRRDRDMEISGEAQRHEDEEWVVPHPRMVGKNQEGYLRSKESQVHTRTPSPGFQCRENKSP